MEPSEIKENTPLVTIITPTYNSNPAYLKEAIDSVLMQTYPKIEYIITDDGSKDFPEKWIQNYLNEHVPSNIVWKIIKHTDNIGTVKNLNYAIRESNGKYIFDCAHDDSFYDEKVIEEWVNEFERTGSEVITARMILRNSETTVLPNDQTCSILMEENPKSLYKHLLNVNIISAPATAQTRKSFEIYGYYDEKYKVLEDYPRWIQLTKNGVNIHFWNRITTKYGTDGVCSKNNFSPTYNRDVIKIYKEIINDSKGITRIKTILQLIRLGLKTQMQIR